MSKSDFPFGGGASRRQNWSHAISTLSVNKPVLWTGAAIVISIFAVGFIAAVSKATLTSGPQPSIFAQAFESFDLTESVSPKPVAPTIFLRPAEPAPPAPHASSATVIENPADTVAQAPWERTIAAYAATDPKPQTAVKSQPGAPIECLPQALQTVLAELEARFGSVTIVSTTQLHTENHSAGSTRANLHAACKAVDIKTAREPQEVLAYLKSRPEVGGVNSYRNQVIHFDLNANYKPKP